MKALAVYGGHDKGAAVIQDGVVTHAMEEERPTRIKHSPGPPNTPIETLKWLASHGHTLDSCDVIAVGEPTPCSGDDVPILTDCGLTFDHAKQLAPKVKRVEHHLAHVALAYAWSGWDDCYALAIDGGGSISYGLAARCRNGVIEEIARDNMSQLDSIMNPGLLFLLATQALGWTPLEHEGKLMSLAASGDPSRYREAFHSRYKIEPFRVTDPTKPGATRADGTWHPTRESIKELIGADPQDPEVKPHVAAAVQELFETMVLTSARAHLPKGCRLVLSGGCAQNVVLNRRLLEWASEIWVAPPCHDGGQAAGAGMYVSGSIVPRRIRDVYLGYDAGKIPGSVDPKEVAQLIADGAIVGLCQGREEHGPRALCNRSILANPTRADMAARVNTALRRSGHMPFSPTILDTDIDLVCEPEWRRAEYSARFMTVTSKVREGWKERLPAVVHVDNTCRPQILDEKTNPFAYAVLVELKKLIGVGAVLQTSQNRHGEPIAHSEKNAIEILQDGGMDVLVSASGMRRRE